jgi:predicted transcriptional regulator
MPVHGSVTLVRPISEHPTQLELEILQVLWADGPSTVRHVCKSLQREHQGAFNSIHTTMKIMVRKGFLETERRPRNEGGTIYTATVARTATASQMLQTWARRLFGSSVSAAIQTLVRDGEIKPNDLEELRKIVGPEGGKKGRK